MRQRPNARADRLGTGLTVAVGGVNGRLVGKVGDLGVGCCPLARNQGRSPPGSARPSGRAGALANLGGSLVGCAYPATINCQTANSSAPSHGLPLLGSWWAQVKEMRCLHWFGPTPRLRLFSHSMETGKLDLSINDPSAPISKLSKRFNPRRLGRSTNGNGLHRDKTPSLCRSN